MRCSDRCRDRRGRCQQRGRMVRDARGGVAVRQVIERELGRTFVFLVIIVVVVMVRDDRAVSGVRVIVMVGREVKVRQNLDAQQPHQRRADREGAADLYVATPRHVR